MKIVYMGTPDFAVPSLKILIENGYEVAAVVTQPDRPKGRGNKLAQPPVKELAMSNNITVFQPEKVRDKKFVESLKFLNPDIIIVVAFGQILPKSILAIPKLGCINVHGSLLPKYRGAGPIQWAVINGEAVTGVTTMYMDVGMDTGDMILKSETPIGEDETAEDLHDRLSLIGAELLLKTVKFIEEEKAPREKQDETVATYAPMLSKDLGNIDWGKSAKEINNLVRGTYPWPGAYTYYNGNKLKIFKVEVSDSNKNSKPGIIVDVQKDGIYVQTGNGIVILKEIQEENGKRMNIEAYLAGHAVKPAQCFTNLQ